MCGCIGIDSVHISQAIDFLRIGEPGSEVEYSGRILPSQPVTVVIDDRETRVLDHYEWGFIPRWAGDSKKHKPQINARSETVDTSPYFREAFRERRCLVLASHFFEPYKITGYKGRVTLRLRSGELMCMAGVWDQWQDVRRCAIITTPPNADVAPYHDRSPAVLDDEQVQLWLDHSRFDFAALKALLGPYPDGEFIVDVPEIEIAQFQLPL